MTAISTFSTSIEQGGMKTVRVRAGSVPVGATDWSHGPQTTLVFECDRNEERWVDAHLCFVTGGMEIPDGFTYLYAWTTPLDTVIVLYIKVEEI